MLTLMWVNTKQQRLTRAEGSQGFALVIALGLMAFVLLLLVSMTALIQVETRGASGQLQQLAARQNALLALNIAIGELQRHAGPDQRVTARAEILGDGSGVEDGNKWTAVWNAQNTSNQPIFLVSGANDAGGSNDVSSPLAERVMLARSGSLGPNQEDNHVSVPIVPVSGEGSIGWWVGDEGVKVNLLAGLNGVDADPEGSQNRLVRDFQFGVGNDVSQMGIDPTVFFENNGRIRSDLSKVNSLLQLTKLSQGGDEDAVNFFNNVTIFSRSLLQKPEGGLKRNLAIREVAESELGVGAWDYLNRDTTLLTEDTISNQSEEEQTFFAPLPIPSEIVLWFGFFHTFSDARIRSRFHVEMEFWNPYSRPLRFPNDSSGNRDRAFQIEFENLPRVTIEDTNGIAPILTNSLDEMFAQSGGSFNTRPINSWVEIEPDVSDGTPGLKPGQIYQVLEPGPSQPQGLARDFVNFASDSTLLWSGNQNQRPDDDAIIRIELEQQEPVNIIIREWAGDGNGKVVAEIRNLPFENVEIEKGFRAGPNPFSRSTSGSYTRDDYILAFHVRLASDENDPGALEHLLSTLDLRSGEKIVLDYEAVFTAADGSEKQMSSIIESVSWNPAVAQQEDGNIFSNLDLLAGEPNLNRVHGPNENPIIVYDLPQRNAGGVGVFRFLPFRDRPAFSLGAPWGEAVNALFDNFYFAPTDETSGFQRSHWLIAAGNEDIGGNASNDASDPAFFFVEGGFNINSTSPEAWAAFLGSNIRSVSEGPVAAGFFHAPFEAAAQIATPELGKSLPASWLYDAGQSLPEGPTSYNILGRRVANDQVAAMGNLIAALVTERVESNGGRPFYSVSEFINSGIMQRAIDSAHDNARFGELGLSADLIAEHPINPSQIFPYSHGFLSQANIIAKVGDRMVARSDTFTIRSYGNYQNPLTGNVESEAYVEAVVQRTSGKVNPEDDVLLGDLSDNSFGRKFKVISVRWLNKADI